MENGWWVSISNLETLVATVMVGGGFIGITLIYFCTPRNSCLCEYDTCDWEMECTCDTTPRKRKKLVTDQGAKSLFKSLTK